MNFGLSHILTQTLFTSPSFFSYWNQHFLSCSSLKSTSTRPDCLMGPLKPLESPWQLQMLYKAKIKGGEGAMFTTSMISEAKKSREDAATNGLAFASIWLRGPCLAKLISISPVPLRLSWYRDFIYIIASVFWLERGGILFSVQGENCLVIRPFPNVTPSSSKGVLW